MFSTIVLIFVSICVRHSVTPAQVKWLPDTSFNLPGNFADGQRPCAGQNVHFQPTLVSTVQLSGDNEIGGLTFPVDGELELSDGVEIDFVQENSNGGSKTCTESDAYYIEKINFTWLQADVWDSPRFSAATPDAQKVPCYDDDVLFPENSQFSIKLPIETQHVRSITIKGVKVDLSRFEEFVTSARDPTQSFILNDFLTTGVSPEFYSCQTRAGCPCQTNATLVDCSQKICDAPKCSNPVLPTGNCCPICGGVLEFDININTFNMFAFKKTVDDVINENGGPQKIVSHVGLLWKDRVQVVMVDREQYAGVSAYAVNILARGVDGVASGYKLSHFSGSASPGAAGEIAAVTLLTVLVGFVALYVWYERPGLIRSIPLPHLGVRNVNLLSRFNNRQSSITSLLSSRGSMAFRSSFRNPLFATSKGDGSEKTGYNEDSKSAKSEETDHVEISDDAGTSQGTVTVSGTGIVYDKRF